MFSLPCAVLPQLTLSPCNFIAQGDGQRTCFVSRERGYHGVVLGGMSVGGIGGQPHTHSLKDMSYSKGCPVSR